MPGRRIWWEKIRLIDGRLSSGHVARCGPVRCVDLQMLGYGLFVQMREHIICTIGERDYRLSRLHRMRSYRPISRGG